MKNSDAQLIQRTLEGDDAAFTELVEKYQKQVHALVWRKIGDFHFAEEITQDTFIKAHQQLRTLKKPQRFASWLYVIASNLCSTWLRNKNIRTQLQEQIENTVDERATYSEHIVTENNQITVETQRNVVQKLLSKLKESERTVMTLHYLGEMSCTEISEFLGVSTNTIKSRLRRAQQRLKKEEPMIREALDHFKITPHLTENVMREISRIKPLAPTSSKPFVPWAVAASTLAVVLLILGFGNSKYLTRFQKPYSLDANSETTVEIVDAPIVANLESKPDVPTQLSSVNAQDKNNNPKQQPNDSSEASAETQADEVAEDYTKWELPKAAKARLGKGGTNALAFSPDGSQLAVGSNIGIWLYDAKTGKEVSMFPGGCESLAFSPDGRFLANGGGYGGTGRYHGKEIQLWEISTGTRVAFAKSIPYAAELRFSKDSKMLISLGDWGDTIGILNIETGEVKIKTFRERPQDEAYSESYALTHDKLAIGGVSGKIQLWDTMPGKIWDTISGRKLPTLRREKSFEMGKNDHIVGLAFSPDGSQLAIGSESTSLLWDTTGNNEPIILRKLTRQQNAYHPFFAFSPNGKMLASGGTDSTNTVQLWDTDTGKLLTTLTGHTSGITGLTFSPDGSTLVSASGDGKVMFWNTETNKPLPIHISEHTYTQRGMAIIKDSNILASVAYNGITTFWDLKTQRKTNIQTKRYCDFLLNLAFSPDGTRLAIVNQQLIHFTDVRTGGELARLAEPGHRHVSAIAVSPDGITVAIAGSEEIHLWNTDTGKILNISLNIPHKNRFVHMHTISTMIFSRDGKKLVSADSQGNVQIWDTNTADELTNFLTEDEIEEPMDNGIEAMIHNQFLNQINALAFSENETLLAVGKLGQIFLFGSHKKTHFDEVSEVNCNALVFSPDDTVLVAGLWDGGIQLLDITTGDELATLDGHTASITKLLFSSDGKTLFSTGYDGTILLWDWEEVMNGLEQ